MLTSLKTLMRPLKQMLDDRTAAQLRQLGMRPITETELSDVFVCAYPKSGNTWFQLLVPGVLYGTNPALAPDSLVQDLMPDIHFRTHYRRYATPTYFKSHLLPQPQYRRVIYLLRDGRDTMVSYFHHLEAVLRKKIDFFHMIQSGEGLEPCRWHEHVDAWTANPHKSEILVIKYEDLKADPLRELKRFCEFQNIERDDAFLQSVIASASFDKMKKREQTMGWDDPNWPKDKPFVRRGKVGSFKDEMPPEALAEFMRQAGATMERCGYR